jgi:hypothetical protein
VFSIKSPFLRSQEIFCGVDQRKWPDADELKRTKETILRLLKAKRDAKDWVLVLSCFPYCPSLNAFYSQNCQKDFCRLVRQELKSHFMLSDQLYLYAVQQLKDDDKVQAAGDMGMLRLVA